MKSETVPFESSGFDGENTGADNVFGGRGMDGNSKVGQASEFPFKSLPLYKSSLKRPRFLISFKYFFKVVGIVVLLFLFNSFLTSKSPNSASAILDTLQSSSTKQIKTTQKQNFAQVLYIPTPTPTPYPSPELAPDNTFSISIPSIGATAVVVENVDPFSKDAYMEALKVGVAHTKGTALPGTAGGNIFMFAHSTDRIENISKYNAIFYLLREMVAGDEVLVNFSGIKHRYKVTETKIVEPDDTTYLVSETPDGKERLVLQTCWPPGTVLKRFLVIAEAMTVTSR